MEKSDLLAAGEILIERFYSESDVPGMADEPYAHFPSLAANLCQAAMAADLRRPAETTPQQIADDAWRRFTGE